MRVFQLIALILTSLTFLTIYPSVALAQNIGFQELQYNLNTFWVLFAGTLVFLMSAGFAMLETGFCRRSNAITVLAKNLIVFSVVTIAFLLFGYGLMFGDGSKYWGENGFLLLGIDNKSLPISAHFFFQLTFAGTAATIISGAVAERIKFGAFIWFSFFFVILYSVIGHWVWTTNGLLESIGFRDFAGSTVVHMVGGLSGFIGAAILGPRTGRFSGKESGYIAGGSSALSTLGCIILWMGWFGFNGGSTLAFKPELVSNVILVTIISGATGSITSTFISWLIHKKPSISFIINGILGGCVSITASCAFVDIYSAAVIGFVGGIVVFATSYIMDWIRVDDPVGAVPVHFFCGMWGTLAVGLFSNKDVYKLASEAGLFTPNTPGKLLGGDYSQFKSQLGGMLIVLMITALTSFIIWQLIKIPLQGIRITVEEELKGSEHIFWEGNKRALLVPELSDVARSLTNLAETYEKHEQYSEAESNYRRALKLREIFLRENHPQVIQSQSNLAECFYKNEKHEDAVKLYMNVLALKLDKKESSVNERIKIADIQHKIANLNRQLGRYGPAKEHYNRSKAFYQEILEDINTEKIELSPAKRKKAVEIFRNRIQNIDTQARELDGPAN